MCYIQRVRYVQLGFVGLLDLNTTPVSLSVLWGDKVVHVTPLDPPLGSEPPYPCAIFGFWL